ASGQADVVVRVGGPPLADLVQVGGGVFEPVAGGGVFTAGLQREDGPAVFGGIQLGGLPQPHWGVVDGFDELSQLVDGGGVTVPGGFLQGFQRLVQVVVGFVAPGVGGLVLGGELQGLAAGGAFGPGAHVSPRCGVTERLG